MNWISLLSEGPGVVRDENGIYTNFSSLLYAGHEVESIMIHEIWHLKSKKLFGDGLSENLKTPEMRKRHEILCNLFKRAVSSGFELSEHGESNEFEFFSEIKLMEKFENHSLPEYITDALKEFGNGHLNQF